MEVVVEKLDHFGRGIAYIDGKICFIDNALPGEVVEIEIVKEKKKYLEGKVINIIKESSKRVKSKCPYYNECGGCNILHMNKSLQQEFKENKVKEVLSRFAGINENKILPIVFVDKDGYRNKVVFHVKDKKLGFYKKNTHELIEIDRCLNLDDRINNLIPKFEEIARKNNVDAIMVRVGNNTDDVLIDIDKNNKEIISKIKDKKYIVTKDDFFQVNKYVTELLYDEIVNSLKEVESKNVLDLYCGTGTISIYIKDYVDKVVGVEVVKSSIESANKNKELNKVDNIEFIEGKVEDVYPKLDNTYDTVIVDPPRSGLDKNVVNTLLKQKPKNIIYVSCDVVTLARDLKCLTKEYEICHIKPFDMFKNTYHVENVCLLKLKNK